MGVQQDQNQPSHFEQSELKIDRRSFVAVATEALAAVPLAGLAISNWEDSDTYQVLNFERSGLTDDPTKESQILEQVFRSQASFMNVIDALYQSYHDDYYKSRTIIVPVNNGRTTNFRPQTQYYWDVPNDMTDRNTVISWRDDAKEMCDKSAFLVSGRLIDVNKLGQIGIDAKRGDTTSRHILTALVYGSSIALLWGYEEVIAWAKSKKNGTTYHHERYEKTTSIQETRRGFIKVGAALLGILPAYKIRSNSQERLKNGKKRLRAELDQAERVQRIEPQEAIAEYFGESLDATVAKVQGVITSAEKSILSSGATPAVIRSLKDVIDSGKGYLDDLKRLSADPEGLNALGMLAKCGVVTKQLEAANTVDERLATTIVLLEGLGIFGVMAAVTTVGEIVNKKFPESKSS